MRVEEQRCPECNFDWIISKSNAIAIVESCPERYRAAIGELGSELAGDDVKWGAAQYLWHMVDVIRYGTERLLALKLDASKGAMTWDADEAMHLRRHSPMSVAVGLASLELAVEHWRQVALSVPDDLRIAHPEFGVMDVAAMCKRNAHEVVHHEWDILRSYDDE